MQIIFTVKNSICSGPVHLNLFYVVLEHADPLGNCFKTEAPGFCVSIQILGMSLNSHSHLSHETPLQLVGFLRRIISKGGMALALGPFEAEGEHVHSRPRRLSMLRAGDNSDNQCHKSC